MRIGIFVVASLGVFLAIIYLLGAQARYFERKYDIIAEFTEVGGLIEGATVRLAGVQIGRVTRVVLPPEAGGKVRVTLTVARRFSDRIRRDSEARIVTQGLLGDRLVEITMGTTSAPAIKPAESLTSREPVEVGRIFAEGAGALASINKLATSLQATLERIDKSGVVDDVGATFKSARRVAEQVEGLGKDGALGDLAATARSARRITEQVEKGGLLHAVIYDEPETLRRLNALLASAQDVLTRATQGESAVGVMLAPESGRAARSLLAAMEAIGRGAEKSGGEEGLLSALLFDPQYKDVAADLQTVAKNFREVSERLARGQGLLGGLVSDGGDGPMGKAAADFGVAMANIRVITERLKAGEGTLGALLEDPTIYENLAGFLEGAQRSLLLRTLIRSSLGGGGTRAGSGGGKVGGDAAKDKK
jgi:phospholipid/cholesterol/gamma-HCH transport system substrate-binding protein